MKLEDLSKAEQYAEQAKNIFENINYTRGLESTSLIYGDIYATKANYYSSIDDFQEAIRNFNRAEEEFKKVSNTNLQAILSYSYALMKEGDVYSRNKTHDKAINKFNESLEALEETSVRVEFNNQLLLDVKDLVLAKINFEFGIIESDNLNFMNAANYFENSENKFKQLLNTSSMVDKKKLFKGYFYYSGSKKNYFLFMATSNEDYRVISQDELKKAGDLFTEDGFRDLARDVVGEKLINFPELSIPYKDDILLFEGLGFQKIQFKESMLTSESEYITFNYQYLFQLLYDELPPARFCCEEFCSDWIRIKDNEVREAKIKIFSENPRKIECDIRLYSKNNPEISIGNINDSYYPTINFEPIIEGNNIVFKFSEKYTYKNVSVNIDKTFYEKILDMLKLPQIIISIIAGLLTIFGIFKKRNYLKNKLKSIYLKIRNLIKRNKNTTNSVSANLEVKA